MSHGFLRPSLAAVGLFVAALPAAETNSPEPEAFQVIRKHDTRQLAAMLNTNAAAVIKTRGSGGASMLHLAAAQNDSEAIQLLVARGAFVDTRAENGATPLHWAANCNAASAVATLLDNGANINGRTTRDYTPLHWAAFGNATNVIAILLERGAAPLLRNDEGKTALDLAIEKKMDQAAAVIRAAQSSPKQKSASVKTPPAGTEKRRWWQLWRRKPALPPKEPPASTKQSQISPAKKQPAAPAGRSATAGTKPDQTAAPIAPQTFRDAPATQQVTAVSVPVKDRSSPKQIQIVTFSDNSAYEGELLNEKFHGLGTLMMASGDLYRGQWVNGERQGSGEYNFADGERYKGEWKKGRMWGKGTYVFASGDRLEGSWQNNSLLSGEGSFRFSNGDHYLGEWKLDRPWGKGAYVAADGRNFIGYFVSGRFVGANLPAEDQVVSSSTNQTSTSP